MENLQHRNSTTTVSDIKIGVNLEDSSNKITEILTVIFFIIYRRISK